MNKIIAYGFLSIHLLISSAALATLDNIDSVPLSSLSQSNTGLKISGQVSRQTDKNLHTNFMLDQAEAAKITSLCQIAGLEQTVNELKTIDSNIVYRINGSFSSQPYHMSFEHLLQTDAAISSLKVAHETIGRLFDKLKEDIHPKHRETILKETNAYNSIISNIGNDSIDDIALNNLKRITHANSMLKLAYTMGRLEGKLKKGSFPIQGTANFYNPAKKAYYVTLLVGDNGSGIFDNSTYIHHITLLRLNVDESQKEKVENVLQEFDNRLTDFLVQSEGDFSINFNKVECGGKDLVMSLQDKEITFSATV